MMHVEIAFSIFQKGGVPYTLIVESGTYSYEFDFRRMEQRNTATGKVRPIVRDDSVVVLPGELQAMLDTLQTELKVATSSSDELKASVVHEQSKRAFAQAAVARLQAELTQTREATDRFRRRSCCNVAASELHRSLGASGTSGHQLHREGSSTRVRAKCQHMPAGVQVQCATVQLITV
jgi:hypothetical protein